MRLIKNKDTYIGLTDLIKIIKLNYFRLFIGIILGLLISGGYIFYLNKFQTEYIIYLRSNNFLLGGVVVENLSSKILLEDVAIALDDIRLSKVRNQIPKNITLLGKVSNGTFNQLTELNFKHKYSPEEFSNLNNYLNDLLNEIRTHLVNKQISNIEKLLKLYEVSLPNEAKVLSNELKSINQFSNNTNSQYTLENKKIEIINRLAFIKSFNAQLWFECVSNIKIKLEFEFPPQFDTRYFCSLTPDLNLTNLLGTLNGYQNLHLNYFTISARPTGVSDRPILILFFGALLGFILSLFIITFWNRLP